MLEIDNLTMLRIKLENVIRALIKPMSDKFYKKFSSESQRKRALFMKFLLALHFFQDLIQ